MHSDVPLPAYRKEVLSVLKNSNKPDMRIKCAENAGTFPACSGTASDSRETIVNRTCPAVPDVPGYKVHGDACA